MSYSFPTNVVDDKAHLMIHWDAAGKAVVMEWKTFASGPAFRNGLDMGLDTIMKKGSHRWLADLRELSVVGSSDRDWSNEDWFPRAIAGGITRMALVVPNGVLAQMSVDMIMSKVDDIGLETHYFDSVDEARKWLMAG
jgi:hypothetical protein